MAPSAPFFRAGFPVADTSGSGVVSTYAQSVNSSGELRCFVALPEVGLADLPGTLLALEVWCL